MKFLSFLVIALGLSAPAQAIDLENALYLQTQTGRVTIIMRPDIAPVHVERIKELVREKFYDGLVWHRVIKGFMAQTGDPRGDGTGGSGKEIEGEFSNVPFLRGTVGMARGGDPDSGDSQWFICFYPTRHLNGQYTVWGRVSAGMEHVDAIKKGRGANGKVEDPDRVIAVRVAADVESGKETLPTAFTE